MSRKGFTLVELTIATAILIVLAGTIILRVQGWSSRQELNASARALGNILIAFREKAQSEDRAYVFEFTQDGYQVRAAEGGEPLRKASLKVGQRFGKGSPSILTLAPRGILAETRITMANGTGEEVILLMLPLHNEVKYETK